MWQLAPIYAIIFTIKKLGKITAGSFLLPHKESFVFTNNFFEDFHVEQSRLKKCLDRCFICMLRPRKNPTPLFKELLGRSSSNLVCIWSGSVFTWYHFRLNQFIDLNYTAIWILWQSSVTDVAAANFKLSS